MTIDPFDGKSGSAGNLDVLRASAEWKQLEPTLQTKFDAHHEATRVYVKPCNLKLYIEGDFQPSQDFQKNRDEANAKRRVDAARKREREQEAQPELPEFSVEVISP